MAETIRREASLDSICSAYGLKNRGHFTTMFREIVKTDKVELAASMLKQAVAMLSEEVDVDKGYRIVLNAHFLYGPPEWDQIIPGLFLTLLNERDKTVGVLGFQVGVPFHITCLQGMKSKWNGSVVLDAHKATGKPFDELLVRRMFQCVGACTRFKDIALLRGSPKIAFEFLGNKPSESTLRRMSKYVNKSQRIGFVYNDTPDYVFVRPRLVSGHAAGTNAQCPQKKLAGSLKI